MGRSTQSVANPWVPYLVLGVATIATLVVLLAWFRRERSPGTAPRWAFPDPKGFGLLLATSAGMSSVAGAVLAIDLGGRGALVWLWIATAVGLALHVGEIASASRPSAEPLPWASRAIGGLAGKLLGGAYIITGLGVAIVVGGLFQAHQGAAMLATSVESEPATIAVGLAVAGLVLAWWQAGRDAAIRIIVPIALALYVATALVIALADPLRLQFLIGDAFSGAFDAAGVGGGLAGSGLALALHHGVMRAVLAGNLGLGVAAVSVTPLRATRRTAFAAVAAPVLAVGTIATTTAMLVGTASMTDEVVANTPLMPLERPYSAGLRPSQAFGQTIVIPPAAPLVAGEAYAMRLRSNPRGHRLARLVPEENAVVMPAWQIASEVDTVVFRHAENAKAARVAWDVRVPCTHEVVEVANQTFVKLTPRDPSVEFSKLINYYELAPSSYPVVSDFTFVGKVGAAYSPDAALAEHLAMYEAPRADRSYNPSLTEVFRLGYRGPYADDSEPRPPWGLIGAQGFEPEIGETLRLRLRANPRGEDFVHVNRAGGAEAPPWDFLLDVDTLVVRNSADADADLRIRVRPRLDGWRIRFEPEDAAWNDFRRIATMPDMRGPYVVVDDQVFVAEVHSDTRLPPESAGRRALVPIHPLSEPQGGFGQLPYHPHPSELLEFEMAGPYLDRPGAAAVAARLSEGAGVWGTAVSLLLGGVLVVIAIAAWSEFAARTAGVGLGALAGVLARVAVPAAAAAAGTFGLLGVVRLIDTALAGLLVVVMLTVLVGLPWVSRVVRGFHPGFPEQPGEPGAPPPTTPSD